VRSLSAPSGRWSGVRRRAVGSQVVPCTVSAQVVRRAAAGEQERAALALSPL